jgi:hypothetical protein
MTIREAYTAVIAQAETWKGSVATEPYEAAWAGEAVLFLRLLKKSKGNLRGVHVRVQISPDGMRWADEGAALRFPKDLEEVTFCRVTNFGHYLRLAATLPRGAECQVLATLSLKA